MPQLSAIYSEYAPQSGFGSRIPAFSAALIELQKNRYAADYDPLRRFKTSDAILAVQTARTALRRFHQASPSRRQAFLTLLLFQPRSPD